MAGVSPDALDRERPASAACGGGCSGSGMTWGGGNLASMCVRVGCFYEHKLGVGLDRLMGAIGPATIIVVSTAIGRPYRGIMSALRSITELAPMIASLRTRAMDRRAGFTCRGFGRHAHRCLLNACRHDDARARDEASQR